MNSFCKSSKLNYSNHFHQPYKTILKNKKLEKKTISLQNSFLFKNTNSVPFMIGVFAGLSIMSVDVISNSLLAIISGSTYHVIKATTSSLVS
jgi:ssDNA-specific exonuclease RecJ